MGLFNWIFGNDENEQKRRQYEDLKDHNKEMDEYNWEQSERQYKYAVQSQNIGKKNNDNNIAYQEANLKQNYQNSVKIRNYQERQAMREYNKSVSNTAKNLDFNELAAQNALTQQVRANYETKVGLMLDENNTLMDYLSASTGIDLKKNQAEQKAIFDGVRNIQGFKSEAAGLGIKGAALRADGMDKTNQTILQGLKEAAKISAAGGQGRSATRAAMGVLAESGARQTAIATQLMFQEDELAIDLDSLEQAFLLDQTIVAATRENTLMGLNVESSLLDAKRAVEREGEKATRSNASARNKFVRQQIMQAKKQADMEAKARMFLKPEALPPIPKPYQLPRPKYQAVYKPDKPPESYTQAPTYANPWLQGLQGIISAVPAVVTAFATGGTSIPLSIKAAAVANMAL